MLDWLRAARKHTTFTTSVCTGGLVLAAAGLSPSQAAGCPPHRVDERPRTGGLRSCSTHWARRTSRSGWSSIPRKREVPSLRGIITAAGVSSGIDMALRLVELLVGREAAEASQLMIEYDHRTAVQTPAP